MKREVDEALTTVEGEHEARLAAGDRATLVLAEEVRRYRAAVERIKAINTPDDQVELTRVIVILGG